MTTITLDRDVSITVAIIMRRALTRRVNDGPTPATAVSRQAHIAVMPGRVIQRMTQRVLAQGPPEPAAGQVDMAGPGC